MRMYTQSKQLGLFPIILMFILASCRLEITSVNDTPLAVFGEDEDTAVVEMDPTLLQRTSDPQNRGTFCDCYY